MLEAYATMDLVLRVKLQPYFVASTLSTLLCHRFELIMACVRVHVIARLI